MTEEERKAAKRARAKRYYEEHREEIRARQAAYYEAHREERAAASKRYYAEHREELAARSLAYYAEHREERVAYRRRNREKIAAQRAGYRRRHRTESAAYKRARRARTRAAINLLKADGCVDCGCVPANLAALHFHHLIPSEKSFEIALAAPERKSPAALEAELAKCVVVCEPCHVERHRFLNTTLAEIMSGSG